MNELFTETSRNDTKLQAGQEALDWPSSEETILGWRANHLKGSDQFKVMDRQTSTRCCRLQHQGSGATEQGVS